MLNVLTSFSRDKMRNYFYLSIAISLLLHLISISHHFEFKTNPAKSLSNIDEEKVIKLKLVSEKKKQIVETRQTESEENLDKIKNRFLSNKKNIFEKETIAKNIGKFQNATTGSSGQKGLKSIDSLDKISLKDLNLSDLSKFKIKKTAKVKKGDQAKNKSNTTPSTISRMNDFIDDVPIGELTQLNTSEFKFYGFYYRIKQRLEQHWGNSLREKARTLSRRSISSAGNKITALVVILDSLGRIVKVHLKSTSGVEELDAAAIESFNKAGPFPNPPTEMLQNGKAKIEWGFVVRT